MKGAEGAVVGIALCGLARGSGQKGRGRPRQGPVGHTPIWKSALLGFGAASVLKLSEWPTDTPHGLGSSAASSDEC